jgi:predicted metal-dependent hydrolase
MTDLVRFRELFEAGDYHGAHDALEPRWIRTRSHTLHGLIQLAVGWHHLSRGNLHGARVLWTKALAHLEAAWREGAEDGAEDEGVDRTALIAYLRHALEILPSGRRLEGKLPEAIQPPAILLK